MVLSKLYRILRRLRSQDPPGRWIQMLAPVWSWDVQDQKVLKASSSIRVQSTNPSKGWVYWIMAMVY